MSSRLGSNPCLDQILLVYRLSEWLQWKVTASCSGWLLGRWRLLTSPLNPVSCQLRIGWYKKFIPDPQVKKSMPPHPPGYYQAAWPQHEECRVLRGSPTSIASCPYAKEEKGLFFTTLAQCLLGSAGEAVRGT